MNMIIVTTLVAVILMMWFGNYYAMQSIDYYSRHNRQEITIEEITIEESNIRQQSSAAKKVSGQLRDSSWFENILLDAM